MSKILLNKEAEQSLLAGVNKLADAVKITMGAKGKLVIIEDKNAMVPSLTKDGATVAENVYSDNPHEELGIKMLREATYKSLSDVEDGTTTATVLGQALINNGINLKDPSVYYKDLELVLKELSSISFRAKDKHLKQVATLASNGDTFVGDLVFKAFKLVGKNGHVGVETTALDETTLDVQEGVTLDSGLVSPYFATDSKNMECHLDKPKVFVVDSEINSLEDILPLVHFAKESQEPVLIFSKDISSQALETILYNNSQGTFKIVWSRIPENEDSQVAIMTDLLKVCGITTAFSKRAQQLYPDNIGQLKGAILRRGSSSLISDVDLSDLIKELQQKLKTTELDSFLKRRIKNLNSRLVKIKVGGVTDLDLKERRDRVDDAVGALRSATISGVVPGGGNALSHISTKLKGQISEEFAKSLKAPQETILHNAGIETDKELFLLDKGYNVADGEYKESLTEAGILDSTHSIKSALEASTHVAVNIINTKGSICF